MDAIRFYKREGEFGYLSNFAHHEIDVDGKAWPTVEHYFQAQKFAGTEREEVIRRTESPMEAAKIGRDRSIPIRPDWEDAKEMIMYKALYAKFTQHAGLKEKLLATGDAELIEHTPNDSYWADGGDGTGKNMLGRLLMIIREKLRR
ncbi:MAG: NADAR family protein [Candidatus Sumerlaeia bacterium]